MASNSTKIYDDISKLGDNILEDLKCRVCLDFCKDPIETECCHNILCKSCIEEMHDKCPFCRKICTYSSSITTQRMINTLDHECEFCKEKFKKGEIKIHNLKCEKILLNCPCCKQQMDKLSLIKHLADLHREELMKNMNLIVENFELKNIGRNERVTIDTLTNSKFRVAKLGITGKYYCGTNIYGPNCSCCNKTCGINGIYGCNCSSCMKLDIKSRNLPNGWLVNSEGFNSLKNQTNGLFYCGRKVLQVTKTSNGFCDPGNGQNCIACKKLNEMEKECYKNCIIDFQNQSKRTGGNYSTSTISKKSNLMNIEEKLLEQLICPICGDFCTNPVETKCCHKLFCKACIEIDHICIYCKESCEFEDSIVSKRRINDLPHDCLNCNEKITRGDIIEHNLRCEKLELKCPVCSSSFGKLDLVFHLIRFHNKELMKNMNSIIENFESKNIGKNQRITIEPAKNSMGKIAKLGKTGKYYCGSKLDGPLCMCCDSICGIESGCNCSSCMKLDIKSRNLPLGWLVNSDGFNSRKNGIDGIFYCGRKCRKDKNNVLNYCGPNSGKNCTACKRLDLIANERYGAFFQPQNFKKNSSIGIIFKTVTASLLNPFDT